jgi:ribose transport system substrate-binding protein
MNAQHGPILVEVLKDEDRLDQIKLVTFDTVEETLEGIEQGHIFATVAQDAYQYGYEAVRLLDSYCRRDAGQLPPPGVQSSMNISTKPVRRDNVAEYRASHRGTDSNESE